MYRRIISLLIAHLFFCLSAYQQQGHNNSVRYYSTADGLAGNDVVKTLTDKNGFLWIATHNGISRFDGREFRNYTHVPGDTSTLRSIWVTDMIMDQQKRIWATTEWGLCYYDEITDKFRYVNNKDSITILYKSPVIAGKNGDIWLAAENGLFRYDNKQNKVYSTSLTRIVDPQCIAEAKDGDLIIGSRGGGMYRYSPAADKSEKIICKGISPGAHYMNCMVLSGSVWFATSEGLLEINDNENIRVHTATNGLPQSESQQLLSLYYSEQNNKPYIICCTYDKRMVLFDIATGKFIARISETSLPGNNLPPSIVYDIHKSGQYIWYSTQRGLYKISLAEEIFYPVSSSLTSADRLLLKVQNIIPDKLNRDRYIIFSSQNNGTLLFYNHTKQQVEKTITGMHNLVPDSKWQSALLQDSAGNIYTFAGQYITIYSHDGKLLKEINIEKTICCACFDQQGNIWMGTADGVSSLNLADYSFRNYDCHFSGTDIEKTSSWFSFGALSIFNENSNTLWVTSIKYGLFSFNKRTGEFNPHRQPFTGLYETLNRCSGLVSFNDTLWVSNMAGLTAYIQGADKFINYNISHGLKSTYVYSVARTAGGKIWGRGNMGLFSFDPATARFENYTLPAVVDDEYYLQKVFTDNEKCLLGVAGKYGLFEKKEASPVDVGVTLDRLVAGKSSAVIQRRENNSLFTNLSYYQNDIRIDFSIPDFSGEPVYYSYMLSPIDKDWIEAGEKHQVNYSNISPGSYSFKVKYRRGEGNWSSGQTLVVLKIQAAFWQTAWFRSLIAFVLAGLIAVLYFIRIRQIKKRQREKYKFQQLELEKYKQQLEMEQVTSFFSGSLIDKKNVPEVLTDVAKNLIGKMGFEDCMIYLWNADKTKLVQHAGHGIKGAIENTADKEKYHIPAGHGIVGATVSLRQPVIVNDTSADARYISADGIIRLSELCVPIMDNDEIFGAINIEQTEKNYFTKQHLQTVSTIATLMANKIRAVESTGALHQKQLELAETSKQLAEREVAMLRSQMNPHFIFNSLNSVQKYIWENKEEDAAEYLASFAKLMRSILENSRHEYISLEKELAFLKLYIELENRRSNNSFNYTIKTDEQLDKSRTLIPPMLLQPFIENAIWHGLNKKTEKGNLLVHIYKENNQLVSIVDDDGVGRTPASKEDESKKSLGISITRQRVERLIENTSLSASVQIKDKINNGMPAGTMVTVILPLQTDPDHA